VPLACAVLAAAACGRKGPPLPPLSRTPAPAADLEATLSPEGLEMAWTARPPLEAGGARVEHGIYWDLRAEPGAAPPAADPERPAPAVTGKTGPPERSVVEAGARDDGPAAEWPGEGARPDRRLRTRIDVGVPPPGSRLRLAVVSRSGRRSSAPSSLEVRVPAVPLPAPEGFELLAEEEGIRLRWRPAPAEVRLELFRREGESGGTPVMLARVEPAVGEFLDRGARLGVTYRYAARLRAPAGPRAWVAGPTAAAGPHAFVDSFAPKAPQGLALLIEAEGVRLLWTPNREADLAGYRIYRRLGDGEAKLLESVRGRDVTWVDTAAPEGQMAAYRLTAFDTSPRANESAPSEPAEALVRRPRTLSVPQLPAPPSSQPSSPPQTAPQPEPAPATSGTP